MSNKWSVLSALSVLFALAALACAPSNNSLNRLVRTGTGFGKGFTVYKLDVRPTGSPNEVEAWVSGVIHDPCTRVGGATQNRKMNVIDLDFSIRPIDVEGCADDTIVEFVQIVVLNIGGVGDGTLFVRTGDVTGSIKLPLDS